MSKYKGYEFEVNTAVIDGVTKTWAEWCVEKGVSRALVHSRMYAGDTFENAIKRKPRERANSWWRNDKVTIDGVTKTPIAWAEEKGLSKACVYQRMYKGMTLSEALAFSPTAQEKVLDTESVEINGEKKTMREWCKVYGVKESTALQRYHKTQDPMYSVLDHNSMIRYRRKNKVGYKVDKWYENELSIHPTSEVVEMCTNCKRPDCNGLITTCLRYWRGEAADSNAEV